MDKIFKDAVDPTVDISEVTQHLGIRAGTEFAMHCRIREKLSMEILERQLDNLAAERAHTAESEWRFDRYGKDQEIRKSQSPAYDPNGIPTRTGPSTN